MSFLKAFKLHQLEKQICTIPNTSKQFFKVIIISTTKNKSKRLCLEGQRSVNDKMIQ
jgi:hypothetical protein